MTMSEQLIEAIKQGDKSQVQQIIDTNLQVIRADASVMSPILLSIYMGKHDIAEILVATGIDLTLHEATAYGASDNVVTILQTSPDMINTYSTDGFTALGLASYLGHDDIAKMLIEHGADVNLASQNTQSVTPLHSATSAKHSEIIQMLLENGADINMAQHGGITPLMQAAHHGDVALVKQFLEYGADVNKVTNDGKTALIYAEEVNAQDVIEILNVHTDT